jgi:hypothetical protein
MTRTRRAGVALGVVAVFAVAVWLWQHRATEGRTARASVSSPTDDGERAQEPSANGDGSVAVTPISPETRQKMRELIWRALETPAPESPETARKAGPAAYVLPKDLPPPPPGKPGEIEPDYIQQIIRDKFWGRARWCYQQGLKRDPSLRGEIALGFTIVGDQKIGGVVEAIDVLDRSTIRDPELIACIRDYFLDNITFPPPQHGGYVQVIYPMVFEPPDEDSGT